MNEQGVISDNRAITVPGEVQSKPVSDASAAAGYGARLALQRQSAGLSVTDVAASLRLHPNQVRAIEQEDLTRLPALAYVRGFIRSYARVLNIDPAPLLADLNAKLAPVHPSVVDNIVTDYSAARAEGRARMWPRWAIGVAMMGLVVLGLIGWQTTQQPAPAPSQADVVAVPAPPPAPATTLATDANAAPVPSEVSAAPADPIPAPAEAAEPTVRSSVIATGAAPTLVLRFNGASWAEVTDRNGKILLSQLSAAGAEHALDGELPLTVVIGDANFVSVEVRGSEFNLQPVSRNNVARFIIK